MQQAEQSLQTVTQDFISDPLDFLRDPNKLRQLLSALLVIAIMWVVLYGGSKIPFLLIILGALLIVMPVIFPKRVSRARGKDGLIPSPDEHGGFFDLGWQLSVLLLIFGSLPGIALGFLGFSNWGFEVGLLLGGIGFLTTLSVLILMIWKYFPQPCRASIIQEITTDCAPRQLR